MKYLLLTLLLISNISIAEDKVLTPFQLRYQATEDTLSLNSEGAMLKGILGSLTIRTGVETFLDENADTKINQKFEKLPLEKAIKTLCKSLNCIIRYEKDKKTKEPFIVGLEVLPTGKEQSDNLPPVVPMMGELNIHARQHQAPEIFAFIQKRLEARLDRLPPAQREQMLDSYRERIKDAEERKAEREKRKREREQRKADRDARRAARDEELRLNNPERYQLMMDRRAEIRGNQ